MTTSYFMFKLVNFFSICYYVIIKNEKEITFLFQIKLSVN